MISGKEADKEMKPTGVWKIRRSNVSAWKNTKQDDTGEIKRCLDKQLSDEQTQLKANTSSTD